MSKPPLTEAEKAELAALKAMPDAEIDFSDAPEMRRGGKGVRGKFYKPVKEHVNLRLDKDVLEWFKHAGVGYQTRINEALRDYIALHDGGSIALREWASASGRARYFEELAEKMNLIAAEVRAVARAPVKPRPQAPVRRKERA
jgi:uncharacterized protein (DUF4415 family)